MTSASVQRTFLSTCSSLGLLLLSSALIALTSLFSLVSTPQAHASGGYTLADGHTDIFYAIASGDALGLALKEDVSGSDVLHFPEDVTLAVGDNAFSQDVAEVPEIGTPGYYLPQTQQPGILWPGWSTQQVASQGIEQVDFTFDSVSGPGDVFLFTQRGLGDLGPILSDGSFLLQSGSVLPQDHPAHVHANWVFTQPGTYEMTVSAHSGGLSSDSHTYTWEVGGSPSTSIADDALQPGDIVHGPSTQAAPEAPPDLSHDQAPTPNSVDAANDLPASANTEEAALDGIPSEEIISEQVTSGTIRSDQDIVPDQTVPDSPSQPHASGNQAKSDGEDWNTPRTDEEDTSFPDTATQRLAPVSENSRPASDVAKGSTSQSANAHSPVKSDAGQKLCHSLVPLIKDDRQQPPQWRKTGELSFGLGDSARVDLRSALGPLEPGSVWMIGATQQDGVPWVGANSQHPSIREHIDGGLTWELTGFKGPGTMFVYEQGNLGKIVGKEWFRGQGSTAEGTVEIHENTHVHPNWVFSQPGTYEVTITQSGADKDGSTVSGTGTLTFHVGDTTNSDATEGHFDIGAERTETPCSASQPGNSQDGESSSHDAGDSDSEHSESSSDTEASSFSTDKNQSASSAATAHRGRLRNSEGASPASPHRVTATSQQEKTGVAWEAIVIALLGVLMGTVGAMFYRSARKEREE